VDRERFQRLEELLRSAMALAPAEQSAFVDEACRGDQDLRDQLRRLLAAGSQTTDLRQGVQSAAGSFVQRGEGEAMPPIARYQLLRRIGAGGMGVVYEAYDPDLHRNLALKVAQGPGAGGAGTPNTQARSLARFLTEAQITGQLDHPGVVPVYELGRDPQERVYFTMRLVSGRTAQEVFALARQGSEGWSLSRALEVVLKICDTMAFAHDRGVIHRDLKPENVMVGRFGEVYVMDWGVAKVLGRKDTPDLRLQAPPSGSGPSAGTDGPEDPAGDQDAPLLTVSGMVIGTPSYMSPEQATGRIEELDARSDVYAVGACLYTLLTGWQPYVKPGTRTSSLRVLHQVRQGPPKPVGEMDRTIPVELVSICEKAMAREKSERYASMQELAEELRAFLGDRVVKAHRTGAIAELGKWVKRNRGMATGIAAACLVAILGAVVSGIYARRATQSLDRFLQLRDAVTLRELLAEADTLWPEVPEKVDAMADWLRRANELTLHRPQLEQALVDLRHRARALTAAELEEARRRHPKAQELSESRKRLRQVEQELPLLRDHEPDPTEDDRIHGQALRAEVGRAGGSRGDGTRPRGHAAAPACGDRGPDPVRHAGAARA
jgi:serine/threonine protein kinase